MWTLIAWHLEQPLWHLQRLPKLVAYGVFKGEDLSAANAWRLVASQWLHVNFPHMLFNALMIATLGHSLERRTSAWAMLLIGLGGGALGQYLSSVAYPSSFIAGASQAYLALCGAVLLLFNRSQRAWWISVLGTLVAAALDLFVSGHGAIKMGHLAAFAAGVAGGACIRALEPLRMQGKRDRPN